MWETQAGDSGSIPDLGRCHGEGNGNPLQYSCLEIPWTEKPGGLQFTALQKVEHDGNDLATGIAAAAAAAKSLQSCPTLCDPIDGSPPGSPVPGIF